jgi:hypothetical protein
MMGGSGGAGLRGGGIEGGAEGGGGGAWSIGLEDGGADGDAGGAGLEHGFEVVRADSADGEPGEGGGGGGVADECQSGEVFELLGLAGEDRSDAEVTGAILGGGFDLLRGMSGDADECASSEDAARVTEAHVLLAEVDGVGTGDAGEVGPIVHDEAGAGLGGEDAEFACVFEEGAVWEVFFAKLDDLNAAGEGFTHDPGEVGERGEAADKEVEAGLMKRGACSDRGEDAFFEDVDIVPEGFAAGCDPDFEELGVFLEGAEGFGGAFEVGDEDGAGVFAEVFGGRGDVGADISLGVTGGDETLGIEATEGFREAVADFLGAADEVGIIEDEAEVVLDDAESFTSAIGGGIKDAEEVNGFGGCGEFEGRDGGIEFDGSGLNEICGADFA